MQVSEEGERKRAAGCRAPRLRVAISLCLIAGLVGCAAQSKKRYEQARDRYQDCLAENPDLPSACETLRQASVEAGEAYERDAQQAWGCRNLPNRCAPVPGGRPPQP